MRGEDARDWGLEGRQDARERQAGPGRFVQRTYRLVPLTELEQDAYGSGGPMSGQKMPEFKEELVSERYFEGIG